MIEFILNNKTIKTNRKSGMTLLDFVRYEQRLTGTKIGCREGDCGACTVLIGTLQHNDIITYQSFTSCISPLGNAHGKHVVTIEGANLENILTITQSVMKDNFATQCGFCTPGFVVSLTGFALSNTEKNRINALNSISGNICRCTGYKSIEKAANEVCQKLKHNELSNGLDWLIKNNFIPEYFANIPSKLKKINTKNAKQTGTLFVNGGTDLYVQQADNLIEKNVCIISNNDSLKGINITDSFCKIGVGNTVTDLWNNKTLKKHFPNLKKHLKLVSSEQIRNMSSLGGNFVNASPIGDMTIFFLALNCTLTIINSEGKERQILLKEFYKGYKNFDLNVGELIKNIQFKLPSKHTRFNFEKVSKRMHLDIASVNSAFYITIENEIIKEAHLSIGGVAAIPKYLHETSSFLIGKTLNTELVIKANYMIQKEVSPISDVRGSSDYKRLLARQLFFAHFIELFPNQFKLNDFIQYA